MSLIAGLSDIISAIVLGVVLLFLVVIFFVVLIDNHQKSHTILRNYPFVGRFRYWLESVGEFLRQYFFALDREELPFNRAQRSWVYRAAKNIDNTVAFGSSQDLTKPGTYIFLNSAFPNLSNSHDTPTLTIGEGCESPYTPEHFFNISGMSFGAISKNAVLALSRGAKKSGCWMNTGEGGLSPYHLEGGADVIYQIGTAKYGVRNEQGELDDDKLRLVASHSAVKMFEIKLSQGAKPGKGGILPAVKVSHEIAEIRGIPLGKASLSPNRHADIANAADLLAMIASVRNVTGKPVGIKFVMGDKQWLHDLFELINNTGPDSAMDFITLDSGDGGTGAAPQALMDSVGLPLKESLPTLVDLLHDYGLKDRVRVIASGKLVTASQVAAAMAMGADFCVSARGFMFSLGCIQALQCNKNTCPTGIATQNPRLQRGLDPINKADRVHHFHNNMEKEVSIISHSCGVDNPRELRRNHVSMVLEGGKIINLEELYPGDKDKTNS
ncbi:MAG: FMN-binding glutamate synthase family protein [Pseudomonadales bacterium]|nr:FMN-binding glutamate synthase family protein [Pseudomonadales bacterium]